MEDRICAEPMLGDLAKEEYKPSKQEVLNRYEIRIQFLSIGCIVNVGCKSIAFNDIGEAIKAVNAYVEDPVKESEKWIKLMKNI